MPVFRRGLACFVSCLGGADERDDGFDMVERDLETFQDMCACFGFGKLKARAAYDDVFLVLDIVVEYLI